jgi:serine/threonine-protein kinase
LRQIVAGLAALHDAGVVHRDLKPANVLLDDGTAKISDFGISRFGSLDDASVDPNAATLSPSPRPNDLTGTGVVLGTPMYMAPEGVRSARALDASADVFALGIIAYEMLSGRAPFGVPPYLLALAEQPIATPPLIDDARVPEVLRSVVIRCLAVDPKRRPPVREVVAALA